MVLHKKKYIKKIELDQLSSVAAQSVFHHTAQKRLVEKHQEHLRDYE